MPQGEHSVHDLVLFKIKESSKTNEKDSYSFECVDQENKVKFRTELAPFMGNYRYSVLITNDSEAPVSEIKIRIRFPHFLQLNRATPNTIRVENLKEIEKNIMQFNVEFDELAESSNKQLNFFFTPLTLNNKGDLNSYLTFVNNKDFVRVLNSEPLEIKINPININPKIVTSEIVGTFLKIKDIKKAIKSIGIGMDSDPNFDLLFNHVEQVIRAHNFYLIVKDPIKKISWFYGSEIESKEDVLVIGQIVSNKVEFLAASKNHPILVSILTELTTDFKKRILSMALIKSLDQTHDLECKFCGTPLPIFPKKGETIECKACKEEQVVW